MPDIKGDKDKLNQIFMNLLGNARDAIGKNGAIYIKTQFNDKNDEIIIYVGDNGCGIPPEKISRIFDPFYTTKPVDKGTGLGLSVTFGILKDFGGNIKVESPPSEIIQNEFNTPQNTVFIVRLPVLPGTEPVS